MSENELQRYINDNLSIRQMCEITGKGYSTIRYWLSVFNLKTNHKSFGQAKLIQFRCWICGDTNPDHFYGHKKSLCKSCYNAKVITQQDQNKRDIVKYLGGKCVKCGYDKACCSLEVHHLDPTKKKIRGSSLKNYKIASLIEELDGCILLCSNCHKEEHHGILPPIGNE
jgi:hypothetical protein